ncbi:MAG: ABC transporter permease [Alphaproteobacteria bacterium]|nr:ABC transporter permease [Alphaproteobacteria bacterium]
MIRYLLDRLVQSAAVLLVMSLVIYALIGLMPGDPVDLMISADPKITSADAARLRALYGLDRPLVARYASWLQAALVGDFGYSRLYARPALDALWPALVSTTVLVGLSFLLALMIALPAGVWAARHPDGPADRTINVLCFAGISTPPFWLAILLILLFAVWLGWLPAGGVPTRAGAGWADYARHMALPVATLTLLNVGAYLRFMRASMLETLRQDYIRTAEAKGAGTARVLLRHALRNALIPVVTVVALGFGGLFSGALITEKMFAWPGMGNLIFDSIMGNDYNLALVALLFATLLTLVGNLLADLGYAWLDPRISYTRSEK